MFSIRAAKGEGCGGAKVDLGDRYSRKGDDKPSGKTAWLGRNFSAFEDSAGDDGRSGLFAHITVWCVLSLDKYCSNCAREGVWLGIGLQSGKVNLRSSLCFGTCWGNW